MRFLVSALGSAGDVHPFIAISQALRARGHAVRMLAAPTFEARIVGAGVDFTPLGAPGEFEALLQRPELWQPRAGTRFVLDELLRRLPEGYAAVDALAVEPGTVLVGSTLAWANRLVQERRGLPGATVHLSPLCVPSASAAPVLPGVGDPSWIPAPLLRLLVALAERLVLDPALGPRLNGFRATIGLPPVRRIVGRWVHSPDLVVCAWPEWFAPAQRDWPPQAVTSGFPMFAESGASRDAASDATFDAALARFVDAGAPPVGITPGSAMAHGAPLFDGALAACRALGRRAVVVTPYRDQLPMQLPDDVHHVAYAPFGALLPRLSALVHHGGIGTSAQALAAGVPQLVVPFAHDQFDNAARLRRLGVATTSTPTASGRAWSAAMRPLFESAVIAEAVRVNEVRMRADAPAADRIAALLERLGERARHASRAIVRAVDAVTTTP